MRHLSSSLVWVSLLISFPFRIINGYRTLVSYRFGGLGRMIPMWGKPVFTVKDYRPEFFAGVKAMSEEAVPKDPPSNPMEVAISR